MLLYSKEGSEFQSDILTWIRTKACPNQIKLEIEPFMNTQINSVKPQSAHEIDVHTAGNPLLGFVSRNLTPHVQRFPFPTDSCCWHLFLNQTAVIYGLCVLYRLQFSRTNVYVAHLHLVPDMKLHRWMGKRAVDELGLDTQQADSHRLCSNL